MTLTKLGKWYGCNTYEVRDTYGIYIGFLYRQRKTQRLFYGKSERYYVWMLNVHVDVLNYYHPFPERPEWDSFEEAKQWLEENLE